jgi:protein TonB
MGLQCFLFSSDESAAGMIRQVLASLDVETESCPEAVGAVERISKHPFQIVIIDWDIQPEAELLLAAARERKASERPITLAIVSSDVSVPKALHAGANSILRKPVSLMQANDTLRTARDLVKARRDPQANGFRTISSGAAAAPAPATIPASMEAGKEKALRAGEFLHAASTSPGTSFETESDVAGGQSETSDAPIDPLKNLEPVAASVASQSADPLPPPAPGETRGLDWYLKARGVSRQASPAQTAQPKAGNGPELLSYDQIQIGSTTESEPKPAPPKPSIAEEKKEAELHAYIDGDQSLESAPRRSGFGKRAIIGAAILATCAIVAAPQAPWHPRLRLIWANGQRSLHTWLNPQPVTTAQAPTAHETFARAGDEYKLPAVETIPDATTDPTQIRVVPAVDPTAKKPAGENATPDPGTIPPEVTSSVPTDQAPAPPVQVVENPAAAATPAPVGNTSTPAPVGVVAAPTVVQPSHNEGPALQPAIPVPIPPAPKSQPPRQITTPGNIPQSLKSQMASSTPEASGNKSPETALPSIEPVAVAENAERALLTDQPAIAYPATAKGQQGSVVLQVLIARDGTVQDAKFLQGSLAFARAAIDGVKQWRFKPYTMNGRPVSVQTLMTLSFKPTS